MRELLRQGISDEDVGKIIVGNDLRVWGDVESVVEIKKEKQL